MRVATTSTRLANRRSGDVGVAPQSVLVAVVEIRDMGVGVDQLVMAVKVGVAPGDSLVVTVDVVIIVMGVLVVVDGRMVVVGVLVVGAQRDRNPKSGKYDGCHLQAGHVLAQKGPCDGDTDEGRRGEDDLASGGAEITDEWLNWLERKIVDVDSARVKRVVIRHPDGQTLTVSKATAESQDFTIDDMPEGKKLIIASGPNAVGASLSALQLDDIEKASQPFDPKAAVSTEVTTFDGLSLRVLTAKRDGNFWLRIEATGEAGGDGKAAREANEIMTRTGGWTYKISAYAASNIARRMENLVEDVKPKS